MGLTYDSSGISAMLDDVRRDVGKAVTIRFSTSVLRSCNPFHSGRRSEVEGFQHSTDPVDACL